MALLPSLDFLWFDPESDPDGEATDEEVATQRLQQDVSEWLVIGKIYLNIFVGKILCLDTVLYSDGLRMLLQLLSCS